MTIAVGILASDGVVIAADSQETVQGYWKGNQGKVWWAGQYCDLKKSDGRSAGVCGAAGASNRAGYVDALTMRLLKAFQRDPDAIKREDMEKLIEKEAAKFHREHTAPYSDLPDVSMVFGYCRNYQLGLFTTDRGAAMPRGSSAAVGIGAMEAQAILGQIGRLRIDLKSAIILAAYAVFQAKEHVDSCGNFTDIVYLREHIAAFVRRESVEDLEKVFRRYSSYLEVPLLHRVLGARVPPLPNAGEMIEVLRRDIEGVNITLIDGIRDLDPLAGRPIREVPKRGRKVRPASTE